MRTYLRDFRFMFFALGTLFAFVTSAPNTYALLAAFHDGAHAFPSWGAALALCGVLLLELGAIGAMIAGVWWLCYSFLGMTFAANWIIGADVLARADLAQYPTFAALRDGWAGGALPFTYAALVPVFLAVFLHSAVARAHALSGAATHGAHPELAQLRTEVRDALTQLAQRTQPQLTADQVRIIVSDAVGATHARALPPPDAVERHAPPARRKVCPNCKAPVNARSYQRIKERGYCAQCKP
jgi:hypothetical protein